MWYVLNYVPEPGFRKLTLPKIFETFNATVDDPLQLFAPTFISLTSENGKVKKTEKPLLFHYIFVKGSEENIKMLCRSFEGFSFVMDHTGIRRHLAIDDEKIERFKIIAKYYGNKLPCYPIEDISLEEGDIVQIISGPCAGLKGTFISRKGGKSGNILVSVNQSLAAVVYDVKADYVRVLEFSKDSRRAYDQIDAYTVKLLTLSPDEASIITAATVFTSRFSQLKLNNPKLEAKLRLLLYVSYYLLGNKGESENSLEKYRNLSHHITNPWTKALLLVIEGRITGKKDLFEEATEFLSKTDTSRPSHLQRLILSSLPI